MKFKGLLHRDRRVMQTNAHEYLFTFYKLLPWPFSAPFSTLVCVQVIHISWFKSHSISVFTAERLSNIFTWGITPDDSPCSALSVRTAQLWNSIPKENWKLPFSDHTSFSRGTCLVFQSRVAYFQPSVLFLAWRKVQNSSLPSWGLSATLCLISIPLFSAPELIFPQ